MPIITTDKDDTLFQRVALSPRRLLKKPTALKSHPAVPTTPPGETSDSLDLPRTTGGAEDDECDGQVWETEVDEVILVRKLGSVLSLRNRRSAVLRQLELVSGYWVKHRCVPWMNCADVRRMSSLLREFSRPCRNIRRNMPTCLGQGWSFILYMIWRRA